MEDRKFLSGLFEACRDGLEAAAERWRQETIAALDAAQAAADSMQFANRLFHAQRALDRSQPFLARRLVQLIEFGMTERLGGPPAERTRRATIDEMGLVDDDVVNESIEVSRIVGRIQLEAEWELRDAEGALSRGLRRSVSGERASPLHPETIARAVWRLTEEMSLSPEERVDCLRGGPEAIAGFAITAYTLLADACTQVPARAVRAAPLREPVLAGDTPAPVPDDHDDFAPTDPTPLAEDRPMMVTRDHVFEGVIGSIDSILSDARLTPELKRVLSGLQMATMRFALGSPEILYAPGHPLWSVVRTLAEYALTHCVRDRLAHDDFILFVDDKIRALVQLDARAEQDLAPHLAACETFALTRSDQLIETEQTAIRHFARLEDSRRKILGVALNRHREHIDTAIGGTEMPFRLRQFLLADWAEVLARTELSEGPDSGAYGEYLQATRRVIGRMRSSEPGAEDDVSHDVPALLSVLERGMASIALPSVEKHELASALMRPTVRDWADSELLVPGDAGGRRPVAERAYWGMRPDGMHDDPGPTTEGMTSVLPAGDAQHWINSLRVGTVIEMFLLGTWLEARVTSIDSRGSLFTFEDDAAGRSHSLTRRALLRLVREGLASPP